MNQDIYYLDPEQIKGVEYTGDSEQYDVELRRLAPKTKPCVAVNPWLEDSRPYYFIEDVDLDDRCQVYTYRGEWVAKFFPPRWDPEQGYDSREIEMPKVVWRKNPDLDRTMTFEDDPFNTFQPDPYESKCELVWYIDPRFNPLKDQVWAMTCRPLGGEVLERREMGYLTPKVLIEINPDLPEFGLDLDRMMPAFWELDKINAYKLDPRHEIDQELWVVKITPEYRTVKEWVWRGVIEPKMQVTYNKDLPRMNYEIDTDFPYHDLVYEHVYYLSPEFSEEYEVDIWAFKIKFVSDVTGTKDQGYISPVPELEFNPMLGQLDYDMDLKISRYDLAYEHYWYIDSIHTQDFKEDIWAIRLNYAVKPKGQKHNGYISPIQEVRVNKILKDLDFDLGQLPAIQYYDFAYRNAFILDQGPDVENEIWAIEIKFRSQTSGYKKQALISPVQYVSYNPEITNIKFKPDYLIPFHDRNYEHVWYLEPDKNSKDLIWVAKKSLTSRPKGVKTAGYVKPLLPQVLDVFFISYREPDAERNWQRVKEKAPWAKRIDRVKGIFAAHRAAAQQSETDLFYVVDGDAYLVDDWNFDFQPDIFNRHYTHVWQSRNPLNDLVYGYGGVKLLPRSHILRMKTWRSLDFTSSVGDGLKVIDTISNITKFNTDPYNTWRSAFRETIKLSKQGATDVIDKWTSNYLAQHYAWAVRGVEDAKKYYAVNHKDRAALNRINDVDWLQQQFELQYKNVDKPEIL